MYEKLCLHTDYTLSKCHSFSQYRDLLPSLEVSQSFQKRKRGQIETGLITIRHENIEPDIFKHIFPYLSGGDAEDDQDDKTVEELLPILAAADFLQLGEPFYEILLRKLDLSGPHMLSSSLKCTFIPPPPHNLTFTFIQL
jgi:hypothetical protein